MSRLQQVATLPKQSFVAMKVAFGVRAQYATIAMLSVLMVTQVIGVVIFSGKALAAISVSTQDATNITQTGAKLNASTSDLGNITNGSYRFEYGTTTSYGSMTAANSPAWNVVEAIPNLDNQGSRDIAVDSNDNIYTASDEGSIIYKHNSAGDLVTQWDTSPGCSGYSWQLKISGIATDASNNVYVTCYVTGNILKFSNTGSLLATWAGPGSGNGQLIRPFDLTVDTSGNIYVMDTGNNRIQKFNSSGVYQLQWQATGSGANQFVVDGSSSIATDSVGNVYLADTQNCHINKFNSSGVYQKQWGDCDTMNWPEGLAVDKNDVIQVYAAAMGLSLQKYTTEGAKLAGDVGVPYNYQEVMSIAIGGSGATYVNNAGRSEIYKVSFKPVPATVSGLTCGTLYHYRARVTNNEGTSYGTDKTFRTTACAPNVITGTSVANGNSGAYFNRILKGSTTPQGVTAQGYQYGTSTSYNLGSVVDNQAVHVDLTKEMTLRNADNAPIPGVSTFGLQVASNGDMYFIKFDPDGPANPGGVSDQIYHVDADGSYINSWGVNGLGDSQLRVPLGLALDTNDNVYVTDNNYFTSSRSVKKFSPNGTYLGKWGVNGSGPGELSGVSSIAIDGNNNVYLVGGNGAIIQKFNTDGVFALDWSAPTIISSITTDQDGNVYALDSASYPNVNPDHFVRKYSPSGMLITTFGASGDNPGNLAGPQFIATKGSELYVLDHDNGNGGTVERFDSNGDFLSGLNAPGLNTWPYQYSGMARNPDGELVLQDHAKAYAINGDRAAIYGELSNLICGTTYHYRAYATNAQGTSYGDDAQFTTEDCPALPTITTDSLVNGIAGVPYSQRIEESKGNNFYLTLESGTLPPGMSIYSSNYDEWKGLVGTPTQAGIYTFTLKIEDNNSYSGYDTAEKEFQLIVEEGLSIVTTELPEAYQGVTYSENIEVEHAHGAVTYVVSSGELPDGLSLNSQTGEISGTPSPGAQNYSSFTVQATDEAGSVAQMPYYLTVNLSISFCDYGNTTNRTGRVDTVFYEDVCIQQNSGFGYRTYSLASGSLPSGLTLNSQTGEVTGTPETAGTYDYTLQVSDLTGSDTHAYRIEVLPPLPTRENTPIVTITSPASNTVFDYTHDSVVVTGTGPIGQTITVFMDSYPLGTTTTDGGGNWTYTAHNVFPGTHVVDAKWIPAHDVAFVSNIDINTYTADILVVNTSNQSVVKTIHLPTGVLSVFASATVNHAGTKLYIPAFDAYQGYTVVLEYDIASGTLARQVQLWQAPYLTSSVVVSADDSYAYIANADSGGAGHPGPFAEYQKIDLASFTAVNAPIELEGQTTAQVVSGAVVGGAMALHDNSLYSAVSITDAADPLTVSVINLINSSVSSFEIDDQSRCDLCQSRIYGTVNRVYYIANNRLVVVNPESNSIVKTIALPSIVEGVDTAFTFVVDAHDQKAYISTYAVNIDSEDDFDFDARILSVNLSTNVITDITPSGIAEDDVVTGIALANGDTQLYLQHLRGDLVSMDIATRETQAVTNVFINPGSAAIYHTGSYYIGHVDPVTASTTFSVGLAPEKPEPTCPGDFACPKPPEKTCPEDFDCPEKPTITDETPTPVVPSAQPKSSPIKAPQSAAAAQNSLFALAKRIPEPFAIGFPWLLLTLALILVGIQYSQVHAESSSTKRMQASVAHQKQLVEEQNNFVALSTHYLHTPLTVMEGEISLMVKAGTITEAQATKLKATLTSLSAEAEATLAQEEQDA